MTAYTQQNHNLAVFVIDEQGGGVYPQEPAQQLVLQRAQQLGLSVFLVELNPGINNPVPPPNRPTKPALHVHGAQVISKPHINAFASNAHPNLHNALQGLGVGMIVVMGYSSQQCVKATAIGGPDRPNGTWRPGATQLGYVVLTSQSILRGGPATWWDTPGVRFYAQV